MSKHDDSLGSHGQRKVHPSIFGIGAASTGGYQGKRRWAAKGRSGAVGSAAACAHPALSISVSPSQLSLLSHKHFHLGLGVTKKPRCPTVILVAAVGSVLLAVFFILAVHHGPCTGCTHSDWWKPGYRKEQLAGCCWQEPCDKDMLRLGSHGSGKEPEPPVREITYLAPDRPLANRSSQDLRDLNHIGKVVAGKQT